MEEKIAQTEMPTSRPFLKRLKYIFWAVIALFIIGFIGLQIYAFNQERTNPPVIQEPDWDTPQTRQLAQRACYDCHSNETIWPWYSYIYPGSELLIHDVNEGRKVLNFSEWGVEGREQASVEEMVETISKGQMPLPYYLVMHPEANLRGDERGLLINGLIATVGDEFEPLEAEELEDESTTQGQATDE